MKTIIAGGREYELNDFDQQLLYRLNAHYRFIEVVCGKARVGDTGRKEWAEGTGISVAEFPADLEKQQRAAGLIRSDGRVR